MPVQYLMPTPLHCHNFCDIAQLLTGGEDSMVCLWDLRTGAKHIQFSTDKEGPFTCMAFDPTNRRLVTGKLSDRHMKLCKNCIASH